ncbi:MAG: S-adenosylmethionine:tRNA ribosyltransferase-isomerase [Blastocatellia bacterium]|nr:S-adenosylmethionine:tRNA ribosyltransferase-isomerase [Blastocatellia bacterium]
MTPARNPRTQLGKNRLLLIDEPGRQWQDHRIEELPGLLRPGDLLVVNDAATLPASFFARTEKGEPTEIRLVSRQAENRFLAVILGAGNWRTRTEDRPDAPALHPNEILQVEHSPLQARLIRYSPLSRRTVELDFNLDEAGTWRELYRQGHPIQYSHLNRDLELWDVQTSYAGRPWAMEMPSAGKALEWKVLVELRRKGIGIVPLTHAAGISSSGDEELDRLLPLPEQYHLPQPTIDAIRVAQAQGGRIIAVGTSATRALEGCFHDRGGLQPGLGMTDLILHEGFERKVVDGIISGMHEPTESHYRLLSCFLNRELFDQAMRHAAATGYLSHEFGDSCLILSR